MILVHSPSYLFVLCYWIRTVGDHRNAGRLLEINGDYRRACDHYSSEGDRELAAKCLLKHHRLPLLDDDFLPSHPLSKDAYKDILMLALKKEEKPLQDILEEAKLLENVTNYTSVHPVTVDSFTTTVTRIKQTVSQGVAIRIIFTLARLLVKRVEVHRMEQGPRTATQGPTIPWMALRCVVDELDCCCRTLLHCLETYLPNIKQGLTHHLMILFYANQSNLTNMPY